MLLVPLHLLAAPPAALVPAPKVVAVSDTPTTIDSAELSPGWQLPDAQGTARWQSVELDHPWRQQGWCEAPQSTYRFTFDWQDTAAQQALGLMIHRAGYRLAVSLNGHAVAQFGALDNADADYSNRPLLAELPWHWLQPGSNAVYIQVAGDCRRHAGLSHMEIGPYASIAAEHARSTAWLSYPDVVTIAVCTLLLVASLLYNLLSPNATAVTFAWMNGAWALSTWLSGLQEPPLPYAAWYVLTDTTYALWTYLGARLVMRLCDAFTPGIRRLQDVTLTLYLISVVWVALGHSAGPRLLTSYWALLAYGFIVLRLIGMTIRAPSATRITISVTNVPIFLLGTLDYNNLWLSPWHNTYHLYVPAPIIALLASFSLGLIMMRHFQLALRDNQNYQHKLEREVERQRQELALHYRHEQEQAQKMAVQAERQRIVRDMHDGLGAQLVGMLASVRGDGLNAEHLENEIALAMEHLRDTMDNLGSTEQDLSTVLAQFRFHHEPRLSRAGLHLRWRVEALPEAPWPPAALWEMQQMLREVFANILKHAQAQEITVQAGCEGGRCSIRIRDDGQGFDASLPGTGRGLRHLHERALHLGLQQSIHSQSGQGTEVVWQWPADYVPGAGTAPPPPR